MAAATAASAEHDQGTYEVKLTLVGSLFCNLEKRCHTLNPKSKTNRYPIQEAV